MGVIETGQVIAGHYRLDQLIGSGGSGVVWRAFDERLERTVAVKQIPIQPSLPEHERALIRQRASREARNAARFQHPGAVVVFDITDHEGHPCLVMEYFQSQSLAEVLAGKRTLPLRQAAQIGAEAAAALAAAHRAGIVHRDVKPGNILIGPDGGVKITDFGISKAVGDATLTATGLVSGTAAYLPPEIARGVEPTPASDVFGLGATLFHALEGQGPYGADKNALGMLFAAANGEVGQPRRAGAATDLLLALLSPRPEDRPTMTQAAAALAELARTGTTGAPTAAPTAAASLPGRRVPAPRPATAPHPVPAHLGGGSSDGGRLKPLVYAGSLATVVVAVLALVFAVVNMADPGADGSAGQATTSQVEQSPSSGATVAWGDAGQLVARFYSDPAAGWSLLTPAAQQVYGTEQDFQAYWSARTITRFGRIEAYKLANNEDGSVDLKVHDLTYDGQTKVAELRVVDSGGTLLIDSDTR